VSGQGGDPRIDPALTFPADRQRMEKPGTAPGFPFGQMRPARRRDRLRASPRGQGDTQLGIRARGAVRPRLRL